MRARTEQHPHQNGEGAGQLDPERIVADPPVLGGKPVVRGTRISVATVLGYMARMPDFTELFIDYPELTMSDVQACFAYARSLVERGGRSPVISRRRAAPATVQPAR